MSHRDDSADRAIPVVITPLGMARGVEYYVSPRFPDRELVLRAVLEENSREVLAGPYVEDEGPDGKRQIKTYNLVAAGTFARVSTPKAQKPPKPTRGVSALRSLLRFSGSPEVMVPGDGRSRLAEATTPEAMGWALSNREPSSAKLLPGKAKATTPAAMLERLTAKGLTIRTLLDGRLVAFAEGGRIDASTIEALRKSAGLLIPLLEGGPPAGCEAPECDREAVDVLEPDNVLVCEAHTSPEAWS